VPVHQAQELGPGVTGGTHDRDSHFLRLFHLV
jgi:hypothetical protein